MIRCIAGGVGCLDRTTKIKVVKDGKIKNVRLEDLNDDFTVISKDFRTGKRSFERAERISSGMKDVFMIRFTDGSNVVATADHRFFRAGTKKEIMVQEMVDHVGKRMKKGTGYKERIILASDRRGFLNENHFFGKKHTDVVREHLHNINTESGIRAYHRPFMRSQLPKFCQDCGNKRNRTVVHHVDHNRKNNLMKNLRVVCWVCHAKYHEWGRKK